MAGKSKKKQTAYSSSVPLPDPVDPTGTGAPAMDPEEEQGVRSNLQGEFEEVAKEDEANCTNDNAQDACVSMGQAAPVMSSTRPGTEQARRSAQS